MHLVSSLFERLSDADTEDVHMKLICCRGPAVSVIQALYKIILASPAFTVNGAVVTVSVDRVDVSRFLFR